MKNIYPDIAIDLFASHLNKKCPRFVSYIPLPGAEACNAFTLDWNNYKYPFVFPPFSVIRKTLSYIWTWEVEKVYAIIPWQPSQSWWTTLCQLMIETPTLFPSSVLRKLRLPWDSVMPHPLSQRLRLMWVVLSGNRQKQEAFLKGCASFSPINGAKKQNWVTATSYRPGSTIILRNKVIPVILTSKKF